MRWFNYTDEELIDFAMDSQETLAYELACRLESMTASYWIARDENRTDEEIERLEYQNSELGVLVEELNNEIDELNEKLKQKTNETN